MALFVCLFLLWVSVVVFIVFSIYNNFLIFFLV